MIFHNLNTVNPIQSYVHYSLEHQCIYVYVLVTTVLTCVSVIYR